MTNPELTAAAERLRRTKLYGGDEEWTAVYFYGDERSYEDERAIVRAHLSTVAADEQIHREAAEYKLRPCSCGFNSLEWQESPLIGVSCLYCGVRVGGFEFKSTAAMAWNLICDIEGKYPDGITLPPSESKSRSILRREAAMRGEEPPEFGEKEEQWKHRNQSRQLAREFLDDTQAESASGQEPLQIKAGKFYQNRMGETIGPMEPWKDSHSFYKWYCNDCSYSDDGHVLRSRCKHPGDIIREIEPGGREQPTISIAGERYRTVGDLQNSNHIGEIVYRPGVDAWDTSVNESLAVVDIEATLRANGYEWYKVGNGYLVEPSGQEEGK